MFKLRSTSLALLSLAAVGTAYADDPLLDMQYTRAPFMAACKNQPDETPLPVDARTLVVPGVNTNPNAAIQFNAFWVDLHNPEPPFVSTSAPNPTTCGEFRASVANGKELMTTREYFQSFSSANAFYYIYQQWGYANRPADFDEQVAQRYGYYPADWHNPYPYPWENPNMTNGGSGQLPTGLLQAKDENGNWTGKIVASCSGCHDSRIGTTSESGFYWGRSNMSVDAGLLQVDLFNANLISFLNFAPLPWSTGRGGTDAIGIIDYLPALFDMDSLQLAPSLLEYFPSHAGGMTKAPNWYHRAFKTRQFWDGALTSDNVRSEMAFAVANLGRSPADRRALTNEFDDIDNFLLSMSPQPYPGSINIPLAEQGAVLFHERDLWANGANANIPKPAGNGSCASCHGVYSPRYANDTNYLPDPRLKGISGVITPIATIGTDPERYSLMLDERKRRAWNTSYLAYNDMAPNHDDSYPAENILVSEAYRVDRAAYDNGVAAPTDHSPLGPNTWEAPTGYVAPPLYGVWGGASFFHNGSVPTVWAVLKSSDRPNVWKRPQTTNWSVFHVEKVKGLDYSYSAYDFNKLGFKYTTVTCDTNDWPWDNLFVPCDGQRATVDILFDNIANALGPMLSLAYQSPPPISDRQIESRLVFNTNLYGNGNMGHEFSDSLTDAERWAIIEYLKTL